MEAESDGEYGDDFTTVKKLKAGKKRRIHEDETKSGGDGDGVLTDKYDTFIKPGYKRNYPDNSANTEFPVFVEGIQREDHLGNKNPLMISKMFKAVKGIHEQRRINANKIMLVFKQSAAANDFLNNKCLEENAIKAYIPASSVERIGVGRFIPKESSNEELYNKLSAEQEIEAIRRFKKK